MSDVLPDEPMAIVAKAFNRSGYNLDVAFVGEAAFIACKALADAGWLRPFPWEAE